MRLNHRPQRPSPSADARLSRIGFETLEGRVLLSALIYTGSGDDDAYTVRLKAGDPTQVEVLESLGGGPTTTYTTPLAQIDSLTIATGSGFDSLTIDEINGPVPISGGIDYDGGGDFDELVWNAGSGQDTIQINNASIVDGSASVQFAADLDITVNGNGDNDTFNCNQTAPSTSLTLNGGNGADLLDFVNHDLDAIQGDVTFDGGAGTDSILLNDSANSFDDSYTITATKVTRSFFAGLTYSGAEALVLSCEGGDNNTILNGIAAGTAVTVNGGSGNDLLIVNSASTAGLVFNGGLDPLFQDSLGINAGTFTFAADSLLGTAHLNVGVSNASASAVFNATQHLKSLSITSGNASMSTNGSRTLVTETLDITNGGKLDLRDNDLIVQNGDLGVAGPSYTGVSGMIKAGRSGGGDSIVTSMSSATPPQILTTLASASASQVLGIAAAQSGLWNGQTVTGSSVLVKYTYTGDANLSGRVNSDDYFALDSHYNKNGAAFGYFNGDFNYDGAINGDDYFLIDSNYAAAGMGGALGPPASLTVAPLARLPRPEFPSADSTDPTLLEELFASESTLDR